MAEEIQGVLSERDRQGLQELTLMDNNFLSAFFRDDIENTEFILRIILGKPDLKVKSVHAQHELKNLYGRSVRLDVHAVEADGDEMDVEIQKADSGAGFKRVRHNSSLLDTSILKVGQDVNELPDTYVIFITENDVLGKDQALYPIERCVLFDGEYVPVHDGSHILYVNGAKKGDKTELEKLMHDFSCTRADDMYFPQLATKMRYFKESEKGARVVSKWIEERVNEAKNEAKKEAKLEEKVDTVNRMLRIGKFSYEEIAQSADVSLEMVRELAGDKTA